MKLATFQVETPLGPEDRFGIVHLDKENGWVVDANMACVYMANADQHHAPYAWASSMMPANISDYCELYRSQSRAITSYRQRTYAIL